MSGYIIERNLLTTFFQEASNANPNPNSNPNLQSSIASYNSKSNSNSNSNSISNSNSNSNSKLRSGFADLQSRFADCNLRCSFANSISISKPGLIEIKIDFTNKVCNYCNVKKQIISFDKEKSICIECISAKDRCEHCSSIFGLIGLRRNIKKSQNLIKR